MDAMTSAQTMQALLVRTLVAALLAAAMTPGFGCSSKQGRLTAPQVHTAPYDTSRGDVLWAVAPLRNESGTTLVDEMAISDEIVAAAAQIKGVRCLPLNRTILAMRALEMESVDTPEDLKTLAMEMGVDGILVGSVTAYDPYNPPTLGLSLALYARAGHLETKGSESLDTRQLVYQPTDYQYFASSNFDDAPASVVSEVLDARGHDVQMRIQSFATGRTEEVSALGWKRYMASMVLYTKFAAWHSVGRLVDHERLRLARSPRLTRGSPR